MRKVFSVRVAPIIVGITMLLVLTIGCGETKTIEVRRDRDCGERGG